MALLAISSCSWYSIFTYIVLELAKRNQPEETPVISSKTYMQLPCMHWEEVLMKVEQTMTSQRRRRERIVVVY